ncbi:PhpK family radical SAM P-methyltransferase [Streptomyces sp. NPDC012461]|uniref:PhpK family radical SAM P-methyltransferase n=2 Tax=unclassified Streptomyces TaxID=2593676 RepID=A0A6G3R1G2_9ACTN|nr:MULTISPECIES: PhpK family radical SAM P-methyltransferase [unclassified Streptomyces]NEA89435.1 PhpK family radical SAM P-methyltransferase [Streptomyces sp. SID14436]NEC81657.1 PhpK family radical SAM P-methyltransferase [Streptomyces sp. SID7958]
MSDRIDCLVIGYNDVDFAEYEGRVMSRSPDFPDRRIFMRDHLLLGDQRLPYMDVINSLANRARAGADENYYHVGEVPNLAAVYLTNFLIQHGFSAEFVSLFAPERDRVARLLDQRDPRAVAITTTFYLTPAPVIEIVRFIRARHPETTIVVGGPLVDNLTTESDPETLADMFDLMDADVYVRESQGEATLARVVEAVRNGRALDSTPNLYVRHGGDFAFTGLQRENNSLNETAIDWNLFTDLELGATVQTRTARSCAFNCSFCDFPARAGALALADIKTVEKELRVLSERGIRNLVFIDDTFNVPPKRFTELLRMMDRNDFEFNWYSFFRCSSTRDDETFDLMARTGCRAVFLGIESASDSVLKQMNKSASSARYRYGIEQLKARGIMTFASFVVGFPGENEETVQETIDFLNSAAPTFYRAEPWWYNHRSPIHQRAGELELSGQGYDWRHQTMDIHSACDARDAIFDGVTTSKWIPSYNFDFWALPYLEGKGFSLNDHALAFHTVAEQVMRWNDQPGHQEAAASVNELSRLFKGIDLAPAKYSSSRAS